MKRLVISTGASLLLAVLISMMGCGDEQASTQQTVTTTKTARPAKTSTSKTTKTSTSGTTKTTSSTGSDNNTRQAAKVAASKYRGAAKYDVLKYDPGSNKYVVLVNGGSDQPVTFEVYITFDENGNWIITDSTWDSSWEDGYAGIDIDEDWTSESVDEYTDPFDYGYYDDNGYNDGSDYNDGDYYDPGYEDDGYYDPGYDDPYYDPGYDDSYPDYDPGEYYGPDATY
jgi:hypothetical protein